MHLGVTSGAPRPAYTSNHIRKRFGASHETWNKRVRSFPSRNIAKKIRKAYEKPEIFCEADLQAYAWTLIRRFLGRFKNNRVFVLNKPYFREFHVYPDIVVFKREKPWVIIELKEKRILDTKSESREREKILKLRQLIQAAQHKYPRRGYLIWVARYGTKAVFHGPKGEGARFLFQIPIILNQKWERDKIEEWSKHFRAFSRYQCSPLQVDIE